MHITILYMRYHIAFAPNAFDLARSIIFTRSLVLVLDDQTSSTPPIMHVVVYEGAPHTDSERSEERDHDRLCTSVKRVSDESEKSIR